MLGNIDSSLSSAASDLSFCTTLLKTVYCTILNAQDSVLISVGFLSLTWESFPERSLIFSYQFIWTSDSLTSTWSGWAGWTAAGQTWGWSPCILAFRGLSSALSPPLPSPAPCGCSLSHKASLCPCPALGNCSRSPLEVSEQFSFSVLCALQAGLWPLLLLVRNRSCTPFPLSQHVASSRSLGSLSCGFISFFMEGLWFRGDRK